MAGQSGRAVEQDTKIRRMVRDRNFKILVALIAILFLIGISFFAWFLMQHNHRLAGIIIFGISFVILACSGIYLFLARFRNMTLKKPRSRDMAGEKGIMTARAEEAAAKERQFRGLIDSLYEALERDNTTRSVVIIDAMGQMRNRQAVEPLTALLGDPEESIRAHAAQALGNIGDLSAIDALALAMSDPSDDVRVPAVVALGRIGSKKALSALERLEVPARNARLFTARLKAIEEINVRNA